MEELNEKNTKYFVVAIILLIVLGIILIIHFNNKSLVSGDKDKVTSTTKKTTEVKKEETTTTTTKVVRVSNTNKDNNKVVKETNVSNDNSVYKSVIDEHSNIIYNYKLTDEITNDDRIVSKSLELNDYLKNNNVISLYDISLYNNNVKKNVKNSLINISIPITNNLIGYDEYKIIYVNNGSISDEVFDTKVENGYIKFTTTHLSMYGVIGIKNNTINNDKQDEVNEQIDLSKVQVELYQNNSLISNSVDVLASVNDDISIKVLNVDSNASYKVYYAFRNDYQDLEYLELSNTKIFNSVNTPNKFKLLVKLVINDSEKVYELNTFNIYDKVFLYDKNKEIDSDITVGEKGLDNNFEDIKENENIAIKEETKDNQSEIVDEVENNYKITVNGNIYLVDETDISDLEMNGYLYINTDKEITFSDIEGKLDTKGLYEIRINTKYFKINGVTYTYLVEGDSVLIKVVDEETKEEVIKDDFNDAFIKDIELKKNDNEGIIIDLKDKETVKE